MTHKRTSLQERFGQIPKESGLTRKMRVHQGWWRTNVLNEEPGLHPIIPTQNVCSTIVNGETNEKTFSQQMRLRLFVKHLQSGQKKIRE